MKSLIQKNAEIARENYKYIRRVQGHWEWNHKGRGTESNPYRFSDVGHPHGELRKAIIEASIQKDGTIFYMLEGRKLKLVIPKLQPVDSNWILMLRDRLKRHEQDIKLPSQDSKRGRTLLFNILGFLEVKVYNA